VPRASRGTLASPVIQRTRHIRPIRWAARSTRPALHGAAGVHQPTLVVHSLSYWHVTNIVFSECGPIQSRNRPTRYTQAYGFAKTLRHVYDVRCAISGEHERDKLCIITTGFIIIWPMCFSACERIDWFSTNDVSSHVTFTRYARSEGNGR